MDNRNRSLALTGGVVTMLALGLGAGVGVASTPPEDLDTPIADAFVACRPIVVDSGDDVLSLRLLDDGHSVRIEDYVEAADGILSGALLDCMFDQLELPDWPLTDVVMADVSGRVDLSDFSVMWIISDGPWVSEFLIVDGDVDGGGRP